MVRTFFTLQEDRCSIIINTGDMANADETEETDRNPGTANADDIDSDNGLTSSITLMKNYYYCIDDIPIVR